MEVSFSDREHFISLTTTSYNEVMEYAEGTDGTPESRRNSYFYATALKDAADLVVEGFRCLPPNTTKEKYFEPVRKLIETTEQILKSSPEELDELGGQEVVDCMYRAYIVVNRHYL